MNKTTGHSQGKSGDVNNSLRFLPNDITPGDSEKVF